MPWFGMNQDFHVSYRAVERKDTFAEAKKHIPHTEQYQVRRQIVFNCFLNCTIAAVVSLFLFMFFDSFFFWLSIYSSILLHCFCFVEWPEDFKFSPSGPLNPKKYRCTPINQPNPSTFWNNTYLCARKEGTNINLKWFSKERLFANRRCIAINQTTNSSSWKDNFLCISKEVGLRFMWSHSGSIYGRKCLRMEAEQEVGWEDNYLCAGNANQELSRAT